MQMQVEALGAPTPEMLIMGNYEKKSNTAAAASSSNQESGNMNAQEAM